MIVGVLITVEAAILPPVWEVEDESYHFVLWLEMKSRLGLASTTAQTSRLLCNYLL